MSSQPAGDEHSEIRKFYTDEQTIENKGMWNEIHRKS